MLSSTTKESRSSKNTLTSCASKVEPFSSTSLPPQSTSLPENPLSDDNAQDVDSISSRGKINKQNSASNPPSSSSSVSSEKRNDSPQEIAEGNCLSKGERSDGKINTPKKRFFDLKRTAESATNKISSISPSRFALSLTPKLRRKCAANHKLSQLERQSNLFIRDGSERKQEELTTVNAVMDNEINTKHQQNSPCAKLGNSDTKSKKSSLIPSFPFKMPSTSAANKNSNKTGSNLEILCRNFSPDLKVKQKLTESSKDAAYSNYEEIDLTNEDEDNENKVDNEDLITNTPDAGNYKEKSNCTTIEESSSTADAISARTMEKNFENFLPKDDEQEEFNSIESWANGVGEPSDILSKPEFTSSQFKNIPVRPRKGQVPHMENYCLFDPSVDFCNEKELRKKNFPTAGFNFPPQTFRNIHVNEVKVVDVANEQQTVYDVSEHDERKHILAHHNYYEIDPKLLEQDEAAAAAAAENPSRKSIITETSSSSSSCDYPSLNNSVIETTPSSTVTIESTDENETNPGGKLNNDEALDMNIQASNAINHENNHNCDESVITVSSVVTAAATGTKKKSPQFDRIVKQTARNLPPSTTDNGNQRQTSSTMKGKSTKINLLCHNKTLSFDPLKASHSLPQLQNITVRHQQQIADGDYNIEINNRTTIQMRRNVRKLRPTSSESLDSGFTTPSPPNEAPSTLTQSQNISSAAVDNQVDNLNSSTKQPAKNESTVLTQCDNIQQLIEVSNEVE